MLAQITIIQKVEHISYWAKIVNLHSLDITMLLVVFTFYSLVIKCSNQMAPRWAKSYIQSSYLCPLLEVRLIFQQEIFNCMVHTLTVVGHNLGLEMKNAIDDYTLFT